jgi:hypothetical protein
MLTIIATAAHYCREGWTGDDLVEILVAAVAKQQRGGMAAVSAPAAKAAAVQPAAAKVAVAGGAGAAVGRQAKGLGGITVEEPKVIER